MSNDVVDAAKEFALKQFRDQGFNEDELEGMWGYIQAVKLVIEHQSCLGSKLEELDPHIAFAYSAINPIVTALNDQEGAIEKLENSVSDLNESIEQQTALLQTIKQQFDTLLGIDTIRQTSKRNAYGNHNDKPDWFVPPTG